MSTNEQRVAVVTGAARGIGAACARRLASDGLAIAVLDLDAGDCADTVGAITDAGGQAAAVAADVSDEAAVASAVARVAAELGPPTVLVNNAGFATAAPIGAMTTDEWDSVVDVSLRGAFLMTRATSAFMVDAGWGRVVSISSISALGDPGRVSYASAKAGLIGFTRSLALELGPSGVTVNAIGPGFVVSDMTARSARRLGRDVEEHQRIAAEATPVRRVGWPEDIAHAASFFVSDGAGYVSGQVLFVAGGPA